MRQFTRAPKSSWSGLEKFVFQWVAPHVASGASPQESLASVVERAPEELHNAPDSEVSELRAQLQAAKEKAEAAEALSAVRTRNMDRLLRHQGQNADSLRAMSNTLINFIAQYRDTAISRFDAEESPSAVRAAREQESHIDNLAEALVEAAETVSAPEMVKNTTTGQVEVKSSVTTMAITIPSDVTTIVSGRASRTLSMGSAAASSTPSQGSGDNIVSGHQGVPSPADPHGRARQKEFKAPAEQLKPKRKTKKKASSTMTSSSSMTDEEAAYVMVSTSPQQPGGNRSTVVSPACSEAGSVESSKASGERGPCQQDPRSRCSEVTFCFTQNHSRAHGSAVGESAYVWIALPLAERSPATADALR